jgi:hypothetical protein
MRDRTTVMSFVNSQSQNPHPVDPEFAHVEIVSSFESLSKGHLSHRENLSVEIGIVDSG